MAWHEEYRDEWVRAGYRSDMGSACVVRPPAPELVRVYHLTSAEHAISDIALSRLKVARISDLNDPFELRALRAAHPRTRELLRDFRDDVDRKTGLLCFSENWTEPVLWSHYGAKHRGICLGFDLRRTVSEPVEYADARILSELGEANPPLISDQLKQQLRRTKFKHWNYEQERRVFVTLENTIPEGGLHFYPFDSNLSLAEVILGPECVLSLRDLRQFTKAIHPRAITYQARIAYKWFNVVPEEKTLPQE